MSDAGQQIAAVLAQIVARQGGVLEAAQAGELLKRFYNSLLRQYRKDRERQRALCGQQNSESLTLLGGLCAENPALLRLESEHNREGQIWCAGELATTAAADAARIGMPVPVDEAEASAAAERLAAMVVSKALQYKPPASMPTADHPCDGWVPVPWLIRATEKRLAAWVLLAPRADLARSADPGRYGLAEAGTKAATRASQRRRKGGLSWATLTAHFRPWAQSLHPARWEWDEQRPCSGIPGHHIGCCCGAKLRPSAAAIAATKRAAAVAAQETMKAEALALRSAMVPPPLRDHETLAVGCSLLLVAGQCPRGRIGAACALELMLAARHWGIGDRLRSVASGLWILLPSNEPSSVQIKAEECFLQQEVCRLAAVRRCPLVTLLTDPTSIGNATELRKWIAAARGALCLPLPAEQQWCLRQEALSPAAAPALLPYQQQSRLATAAMALAAQLGGKFTEAGEEYLEAQHRVNPLKITHLQSQFEGAPRQLYLLEMPTPKKAKGAMATQSMTDEGSTRVILAEASKASARIEPLWATLWWQRWLARPRYFDGCLDLHLAVAAVNIGRFLAIKRVAEQHSSTISQCASKVSLHLVEPCVGSGSIAAAALAVGGFDSVLAAEIRPDWVAYTRENLLRTFDECKEEEGSLLYRDCWHKVTRITLRAHDARLPFQDLPWDQSAESSGKSATVVVMNPPWGRKVGDKGDASAILSTQLKQFPNSVFVVICPTIDGCIDEGSNWHCVHSVRVGGRASLFTLIKN